MSDLVYRIEKFFGGVFIFDYIFIGSGVQNIQSNLDIILLRNYNDRDPGFLLNKFFHRLQTLEPGEIIIQDKKIRIQVKACDGFFRSSKRFYSVIPYTF